MKKIIILLVLLVVGFSLIGTSIYGQGNSSIYLLMIKIKNNNFLFEDLKKITDTKTYNNQPYFLPDGKSLFYSSAIKKQTEIYRYFFNKNKRVRITNNLISEYSPTPMPDGKSFSAVQLYVEEGPEKGAQPLVAFPLKGGEAQILYKGDKKIGYHAWINDNKLALFVLGKPHSLQYYDLKSKSFQIIIKNIGHSIHKVPGKQKISFSHIINKELEIIKTADFSGKNIQTIIPLIKSGDYFAWRSEGILITASGSKLYKYNVEKDKSWLELKRFSKLGLKNISRIAFSKKGDRLAVVSHI